jgi:hypothetical protein
MRDVTGEEDMKQGTDQPFADRPYGLPERISVKTYKAWTSALEKLRALDDPHAAGRHYRRCCGLLKGLSDTNRIDSAEHRNLRAQLNDAWAESVDRIEQLGSTYVRETVESEQHRKS